MAKTEEEKKIEREKRRAKRKEEEKRKKIEERRRARKKQKEDKAKEADAAVEVDTKHVRTSTPSKIRRLSRKPSSSGGRRESVKGNSSGRRQSVRAAKLPVWIDGKIVLKTLKPDHIAVAQIQDREFPCYINSIDRQAESVEVRFPDGDIQDVHVHKLMEPPVALRKKMELQLRKQRRESQRLVKNRSDLSLISSPSALETNNDISVLSGKDISPMLNEVDDSKEEIDDGPGQSMNTMLNGIKMRDGRLFIPRYIGDKIQHDVIDVSRHIKLHRRLSYQSMVYELEVNGSEEIYFNIDFTDSKNIEFIDDPFSLQKSIVVKPGRWKEVCFLNVIDTDKPWELHSNYTWNVKNYIFDPNLGCCGGTRLADDYLDDDEKGNGGGGCTIS